jgi:UDP-glucuronate decarboxylase
MNMIEEDIINICEGIANIAQMLSGKTVLITGGQGFLGQYICATLNRLNETVLSDPCRVIVIDSCIITGRMVVPIYKHFEFMNADVVDDDLDFQYYKIDYVMFLAGIASPFYYRKYPLHTINIVSNGLKNYLRIASSQGAKLLFASSSEIYGTPDDNNIPTKETYNGNVSTLSDRACYDESKRLGETLCRVFSSKVNSSLEVDAVIIRPFNFYGPLMQPADYRVLPSFANNILNGIPVELYGSGNQTRTFCYVSDGIIGMFRTLLLGKSGEAYNIGNPNPEISMNALLDMCEEASANIKHPPITRKMVANPADYPVNGDPLRRCPDISKARTDLQYEPKVSLKDGLATFFKWAKEHYVK